MYIWIRVVDIQKRHFWNYCKVHAKGSDGKNRHFLQERQFFSLLMHCE